MGAACDAIERSEGKHFSFRLWPGGGGGLFFSRPATPAFSSAVPALAQTRRPRRRRPQTAGTRTACCLDTQGVSVAVDDMMTTRPSPKAPESECPMDGVFVFTTGAAEMALPDGPPSPAQRRRRSCACPSRRRRCAEHQRDAVPVASAVRWRGECPGGEGQRRGSRRAFTVFPRDADTLRPLPDPRQRTRDHRARSRQPR